MTTWLKVLLIIRKCEKRIRKQSGQGRTFMLETMEDFTREYEIDVLFGMYDLC